MEFKQSRVTEIVETERQMVLNFGYFHDNAMGTSYLLGMALWACLITEASLRGGFPN